MAWFSSCKSNHICPAYQSAFYLDKKIADEEFSYFDKDSLPKMEETIRKSDVLLVLRLGKKRIDRRMAVVPMITIFPEQADSALAMADSMAADSLGGEEGLEQQTGEDEQSETDTLGAEKNQNLDEDIPKEELDTPKPAKKVDLKDPELSDPSLKAEFEESFDEAPKEEDFEEPPAIEPEVPKKKGRKKAKAPKGPVKKEAPEKAKPEEPEPAPADDKF